MAGTFIDMVNRITTELRRSNATTDVKQAINDAILEAANNRLFFNEFDDQHFDTVANQEYYPDLGVVDIDAIWWFNGPTRYNLALEKNNVLDDLANGNVLGGQLLAMSHYGGQFRLYPIPTSVITVHVSGYGALQPYPLVNDADANAWMTEGELYIRALAKRNYLRDVVRDYGEARVYDTVSQDYLNTLLEKTAIKSATGEIRSTQF